MIRVDRTPEEREATRARNRALYERVRAAEEKKRKALEPTLEEKHEYAQTILTWVRTDKEIGMTEVEASLHANDAKHFAPHWRYISTEERRIIHGWAIRQVYG